MDFSILFSFTPPLVMAATPGGDGGDRSPPIVRLGGTVPSYLNDPRNRFFFSILPVAAVSQLLRSCCFPGGFAIPYLRISGRRGAVGVSDIQLVPSACSAAGPLATA